MESLRREDAKLIAHKINVLKISIISIFYNKLCVFAS